MESNLPTWFSSVSLLICSALLFIIAHSKDKTNNWKKEWYGLSGMFVILSLDEMGKMHERSGIVLAYLFPEIGEAGGILNYSWVIVGGIVVVAVTVTYIRFFFDLPRMTRLFFFLAALSFIGGALGVEMANAWIADTQGSDTFAYVSLTIVEEILEMVGVLVFIFALLDYVEERISNVHFSFE